MMGKIVRDEQYLDRLKVVADNGTVVAAAIDDTVMRCLVEMGEVYRRRIHAHKFIRVEFGCTLTDAVIIYGAFKERFGYKD